MEHKHTPGPEELFPVLGEPDWEKISKIAKPSSTGSNFRDIVRGGWSEGEMVGYASCMIEKVKPLQQDASEWRRRFYQSEVEKKELLEQVSALTKENERLAQWKTDAEKSLVESGTAIGALTEQVEKLKELNRSLYESNERQAVVISEFKQEGSSERARANNAVGKYWDAIQENERLREERKEQNLLIRYRHERLVGEATKRGSIGFKTEDEINFLQSLLSKFPEVPNE